jgi:hypothetical protein
MGSGKPTSQHSLSPKQSLGSTVQPCTRQVIDTNVSQKVASVPAQSSGPEQGVPIPRGGRWQIESALQT